MKIRDGRIAKSVIGGDKVADIAAREKVTERQVFRILAKPEVRDAVDAAARAMTRAATIRIQRGAASAADALCSMADGTVEASSGRVSAAARVVDIALRAVEVEDLLSRLLELELLVAERDRARWEEPT